jgi:asparagine synthase (glutamine-hydrolysing)
MFLNGKNRGPESSKLLQMGMRVIMGFHRLAINGLTPESDQPISIGDIHLICNGEIYNYKELYELCGATPTTHSDCEVIVHLYRKFGMEETLRLLDGVFALVLLDQSVSVDTPILYVARDPYGICPLYINQYTENNPIMFSSELKMMYCEKTQQNLRAQHFPPGTFSEFYLTPGVSPTWKHKRSNVAYFLPSITFMQYKGLDNVRTPEQGGTTCVGVRGITGEDLSSKVIESGDGYFSPYNIEQRLRKTLIRAVEKRCECTERPIACLLSGGLDSSLVASIVSNYHAKKGLPPVETYSIGLLGSEDLKYAKIVADYLGTTHTEIVVSEEDFLAAIPEVIYAIESYDTTTVRASIGNYLVAKHIAKHSSAKVIFNGDGADELMGGYLYMQACPNALEYDCETRRLLKEIHAFDVLRSNKCVSTNGLEPRTPFLDREFTQTYLSIPPQIRFESPKRIVEKDDQTETEIYVEKRFIREAFQYVEDNPETHRHDGRGFLPETILWRKKEAFSDGVSKHSRSLFEIIQEYTDKIDLSHNKHGWRHSKNAPKTSEQLYYRSIFERHFPNADILPRFWMPKYVKANDASARTLVSLYQNNTLSFDNPPSPSFTASRMTSLQTCRNVATPDKHVKFAEPIEK